MQDDEKHQVFDQIDWQGLLGLLPRHVNDPPLSRDTCDDLYFDWCRAVLDEGSRFADDVCERLERQCWELESIEDAGLSGRIRYLVGIGAYAAAVLQANNTLSRLLQIRFLRTAHWVLKDRSPDATYDLSNALGPLVMGRGVLGKGWAEILGTWVWLNLGDQESSRHFLWAKSSLRFMGSYGDAIVEEFLPTANERWKRQPQSTSPEPPGDVSREEATAIAEQYLAENPSAGLAGVSSVLAWDEIMLRKPNTWGFSDHELSGMWVAYLRQPDIAIRPSQILLIEQATGRIAYAGSAFDEG